MLLDTVLKGKPVIILTERIAYFGIYTFYFEENNFIELAPKTLTEEEERDLRKEFKKIPPFHQIDCYQYIPLTEIKNILRLEKNET